MPQHLAQLWITPAMMAMSWWAGSRGHVDPLDDGLVVSLSAALLTVEIQEGQRMVTEFFQTPRLDHKSCTYATLALNSVAAYVVCARPLGLGPLPYPPAQVCLAGSQQGCIGLANQTSLCSTLL